MLNDAEEENIETIWIKIGPILGVVGFIALVLSLIALKKKCCSKNQKRDNIDDNYTRAPESKIEPIISFSKFKINTVPGLYYSIRIVPPRSNM